MRTSRIAAGVTVIVLGISGVALANASLGTDAGSKVEVVTPTVDLKANSQTSASVASASTEDNVKARVDDNSSGSTAVTTDDSRTRGTSTTSSTSTTSTTLSNSGSTSTTSTTIRSNASGEWETRTTVSLGLATYAVADGGTVTVNGMTVVAVQATPGWTVEMREVSDDRIKIRFRQGEDKAEFELRDDGELRIKFHR